MFELLSEPVRKYIRDKKWEFLRPIQNAAIAKIISSDEHVILASRTASGKTEAAFLPILSKVNFNSAGVKVLYISPLIALINDQFFRIEALCDYLDVPVTKWHGEASRGLKEKLVKDPKGVVLITPESLEAMFANAPFKVQHLFSSLEYVVIDEIHSFIGTERGTQLKSILSRLSLVNKGKFSIVGLSATIGDYGEAKKMTGDEANTKVLLDRSSKNMEADFTFFEMKGVDLPLPLLKDLYLRTRDAKVLIFPNSRGRAEEIAVKLFKLSERTGGHGNYFSHHSSVDKELREYIEHFAKTNVRYPFAIACTSTLELGIDIGSVEQVVQVDATFSIASLIQRIGRSGRRDGEVSKLLFYATDKWSLLQSLACFSLYKDGFIEPMLSSVKAFDILLHQMLSTVKQLSGCKPSVLKSRMAENFAFSKILPEEFDEICQLMIENDLFESIGGELIIGVEGEWLVNNKDFYSVFKTEENYKVSNYDKAIGEIPFSPQVIVEENLLLAARIWKIVDVDHKAKRISVIPALDGKKPIFSGSGGDVHYKVREKMLQLLMESTVIEELSEPAADELVIFRKEFAGYPVASLEEDRPLLIKAEKMEFFSFQSSKVNRSIDFLLRAAGISLIYNEHSSSFIFDGGLNELKAFFVAAINAYNDLDFHIQNAVVNQPAIMDFSKWSFLLPLKYKCALLIDRRFDFPLAVEFLGTVNLLIYHIEE